MEIDPIEGMKSLANDLEESARQHKPHARKLLQTRANLREKLGEPVGDVVWSLVCYVGECLHRLKVQDARFESIQKAQAEADEKLDEILDLLRPPDDDKETNDEDGEIEDNEEKDDDESSSAPALEKGEKGPTPGKNGVGAAKVKPDFQKPHDAETNPHPPRCRCGWCKRGHGGHGGK